MRWLVLEALIEQHGTARTPHQLSVQTGLELELVERAIEALRADGLVEPFRWVSVDLRYFVTTAGRARYGQGGQLQLGLVA